MKVKALLLISLFFSIIVISFIFLNNSQNANEIPETKSEDVVLIEDLMIPIKLECDLSEDQLLIPSFTRPTPIDQKERIERLISVFQMDVSTDQIESNWRNTGWTYCQDKSHTALVNDYGFKYTVTYNYTNSTAYYPKNDSTITATTAVESYNEEPYLDKEDLFKLVSDLFEKIGEGSHLLNKEYSYSQIGGISTIYWEAGEWSLSSPDSYETGYCQISFKGNQLVLFDYQWIFWNKDTDIQIISAKEAYEQLPKTAIYAGTDLTSITVINCGLSMYFGDPRWDFAIEEKPEIVLHVPAYMN